LRTIVKSKKVYTWSHTDGAPILADAVKVDRMIFLSGMTGVDSTGKLPGEDFESQARQAFENIQAILEEGGSSMKDVVKITFYLTDMRDIDTLRRVRREYKDKGILSLAASTTVGISSLAKDQSGRFPYKIEIDATAITE